MALIDFEQALAALEALLQRRQIDRHLLAGFAAHDERNQHLANAVALEVHGDGSRDRWPARGTTVTSTIALIGPLMPGTPHAFGGSMCVTSEVLGRLAPPMRRVVRHRAPQPGARLVHVTVDDALLPLVEAGRV